jgi:hypothetical protein
METSFLSWHEVFASLFLAYQAARTGQSSLFQEVKYSSFSVTNPQKFQITIIKPKLEYGMIACTGEGGSIRRG